MCLWEVIIVRGPHPKITTIVPTVDGFRNPKANHRLDGPKTRRK